MEELIERVSTRLTTARIMRGLRSTDVAILSGYSLSMISRIEAGKCLPSTLMLIRLSVALNVSMGWMMDESEDQVPTLHRINTDYIPMRTGKTRRFSKSLTAFNRRDIALTTLNVKGGVEVMPLEHLSGEATFAVNHGVLQLSRGRLQTFVCVGQSFHLKDVEAYMISNGSNEDLTLTVISKPFIPKVPQSMAA